MKAKLVAAREQTSSKEVSWRIKAIFAAIDNPDGPDWRRTLRAVEVLEALQTPEARRLLEELAKGAAGAVLTEQAKAALSRLKKD